MDNELNPLEVAARWHAQIARLNARAVIGAGSSAAASCRVALERCRDLDREGADPATCAAANLDAARALDRLALEVRR
jgi:hypothetical protein